MQIGDANAYSPSAPHTFASGVRPRRHPAILVRVGGGFRGAVSACCSRVFDPQWCSLRSGRGQKYTISTYAGGGPQPHGLNFTLSIGNIATEASGDVYFTSIWYNSCVCVFKLDPGGNLARVAGGPQRGFLGDGGPAAKAQLSYPVGLAVDSADNL